MNDIWKEDTQGSPMTSQDLPRRLQQSRLVETANAFRRGWGGDTEGRVEVVPEGLTNEGSLELEQECIAGEEAREKTVEEEKEDPQEHSQ